MLERGAPYLAPSRPPRGLDDRFTPRAHVEHAHRRRDAMIDGLLLDHHSPVKPSEAGYPHRATWVVLPMRAGPSSSYVGGTADLAAEIYEQLQTE